MAGRALDGKLALLGRGDSRNRRIRYKKRMREESEKERKKGKVSCREIFSLELKSGSKNFILSSVGSNILK